MRLKTSLIYIGFKMPFTPYHLGIALLVGVVFYKYLDMIGILVGSVILDVWPFLVLVFGLPYNFHGISHSFLAALVVALIIAAIRFGLNNVLNLKRTFSAIFLGSVIGTFSHVLLDAPLYNDMVPFWPSSWNPFFGLFSYRDAVIFSVVCFIVVFVVLFAKGIKLKN